MDPGSKASWEDEYLWFKFFESTFTYKILSHFKILVTINAFFIDNHLSRLTLSQILFVRN